MKSNEVAKYLKNKSLFINPVVSKLGRGNNYNVFLIKDGNKEFVLRVSRTDVPTENKLKNEYIILKFLEQEGIRFAQIPIFFDSDKLISVLTYAPGKEVGLSDLNRKQLENFVFQTASLRLLKYEKYKVFCRKNKFHLVPPETPAEHLKIFGIKRFRYIEKNCAESDLVDWIKPRLKRSVKIVEDISLHPCKIVLNHGDLAGSNMILDGSKLYFIDWEQAKFIYDTDFRLSYMLIHSSCHKKRQEELISLFAEHFKQNRNLLKEKINKKMIVTKLNDVIWAIMMFTEMKSKGFKNWNRYKKIAYRRMKEYEELEQV